MNKQKNPVKAIRDYCKHHCCCDDTESWKNCTIETCQLWPFRLGKNPYRKARKLTDEQRAIMSERLKSARKEEKE